jgi:hypothetical protein
MREPFWTIGDMEITEGFLHVERGNLEILGGKEEKWMKK